MPFSIRLLSSVFLFSLCFSSLSATRYCYLEERAAWGGNGGWWGGGNSNFHSNRPWRYDNYTRACNRCSCHPYSRPFYYQNGRYCYNRYDITSPNEYENNDTVPGAGLYLRMCRR